MANRTGMFFDRIRDNKIAEHWTRLKFPHLIQVLGAEQLHGSARATHGRSHGLPGGQLVTSMSVIVCLRCGGRDGLATP
jgi:hypothetical protein